MVTIMLWYPCRRQKSYKIFDVKHFHYLLRNLQHDEQHGVHHNCICNEIRNSCPSNSVQLQKMEAAMDWTSKHWSAQSAQSLCTETESEMELSYVAQEAIKDQRRLIKCLDSVSTMYINEQQDREKIHQLELAVTELSKDNKGILFIYLFYLSII